MDARFTGFYDVNGFQFEEDSMLTNSGQYPNRLGFKGVSFIPPSSEPASFLPSVSIGFDESLNFASPGWRFQAEGDSFSPSGDSESLDPVLKYISQILMEENMGDEHLRDPFALQDTEKSLYEVLGQQYPPPVDRRGPQLALDQNSDCLPSESQFSVNSTDMPSSGDNGLKNMFSHLETILHFNKGFEEARKFLPSIDIEKKNEKQQSSEWLRGRTHHERENADLEGERSTKQSAFYADDESELSELFDKVLLCHEDDDNNEAICQRGSKSNCHSNEITKPKRVKRRRGEKDATDLNSLLVLCAEALNSYDNKTASELLKQIREHSSPDGNGSQRFAHYFANGLESRLEGNKTGIQTYFLHLATRKITAIDALKTHDLYITACPFTKLAAAFANKMICKITKKASSLHVIDFGILYGFQWPAFIQHLSMRPGGPLKLRITGIELPQYGFRPKERLEETGHRLANYCKFFNVPFEYNSLAVHNWETIKLDDLNIARRNDNEMLAVNTLSRFDNLLDETTEGVECPRDAVLKLISSMKPDIFVQTVSNGSCNNPFFVTRFKEAVFHFSAIYDAFDATIPRNEPERLSLEKECYGRAAINVVACEGFERVHRPETYKHWHYRNVKAGMKPLPLDQELVQLGRKSLSDEYHREFVLDVDGQWVLQGWKGRILFASSCWIPA